MPMSARGVIFDLDGTLIASEGVYLRAWKEAARELCVQMTDELYAGFVGLNRADTVALLGEIWASQGLAGQFVDLSQDRYDQLVREEGHQLRPGVKVLVEFLASRRMRMAVATSSHRRLALQTLEETGLNSFFAAVVGGDEVARGKPHPEIYREAASRIGAPSMDCVAFEDSAAGVRAALDAGMSVVWIPELGVGASPDDPKVHRYPDHAVAIAFFAERSGPAPNSPDAFGFSA
jgi:HAD superfamily hydrolase (TIGR01509 family)